MSKLEELIMELCPAGVEYKKIGDVCSITRGRVMSKDYIKENVGEYPVYSSQTENNGELGCISTYDFEGEYLTWTTDGANAGSVFYRNGKFSVTNVCGLIKTNELAVITKFLYYTLSIVTKNYVSSGMGNPKLMSNVMARVIIPVPPLLVQEEIVRILDNFTELTAELTIELTARKKQYEYYHDKMFQNINAEYVCVMNICDDVFLGLTSKVDYVPNGGVPLVRANNMTSGILYMDDVKYISFEQHQKLTKNHKVQKGDILVSKSGTLGVVCIVETDMEFSIYESLICLHPNEKVYNRYLLHLLRSPDVQSAMLGKKVGNAIKHLNLLTFRELFVPLPSMEIQKKIAMVLDRFETLCNDFTTGLPAEIEARQKQYEYYRDKLLIFKEHS